MTCTVYCTHRLTLYICVCVRAREATAKEQYTKKIWKYKSSALNYIEYTLYHGCPLSSHRPKWILITPLVNASVAGARRICVSNACINTITLLLLLLWSSLLLFYCIQLQLLLLLLYCYCSSREHVYTKI